MKVLIQLDEHERNLLQQKQLIFGFELMDVTLAVDVEQRSVSVPGYGNFARGHLPPVTKIRLSGTVVNEIYTESWPSEKPAERLLGHGEKETQTNPTNQREFGPDGKSERPVSRTEETVLGPRSPGGRSND